LGTTRGRDRAKEKEAEGECGDKCGDCKQEALGKIAAKDGGKHERQGKGEAE